MSILIKGMDIPEFGEKIIILTSSGYVEDVSGQVIDGVEAVPVPAHGRLIDADALSAKLNMMLSMAFGEGNTAFHFAYRSLGKVVDNAPTVIEAEEGET